MGKEGSEIGRNRKKMMGKGGYESGGVVCSEVDG